MKKIISVILVCVLCWTLTVPALAYNYDFSSRDGTLSGFGKPTSSDEPLLPNPMSENIRRDKTVASVPPPDSSDILSTFVIVSNTEPLYYSDGSIGTIYVERTRKTIKVYEGEQLDNLKKGAGHFAMTSAWNGNVALCGHNRGSYPYFGFVKDLQIGDRIVYTTLYGSRIYEVFNKEYIGEYDYSKLNWSSDNLLTLITCLASAAELRVCVQLREAR